jgi:hypothetical protein
MLECRIELSILTSARNSFSSFCSTFFLFHVFFTATISPDGLIATRYTFPDPPLPITLLSISLDKMSDSVKFSLWNEVSSHVKSNTCSLFRYILITRNEATKPSKAAGITKPITQASNLDEGLLEFWSLKLQLGMFSDGLLAQRRGLFKKLLPYASFSNSSGPSQ